DSQALSPGPPQVLQSCVNFFLLAPHPAIQDGQSTGLPARQRSSTPDFFLGPIRKCQPQLLFFSNDPVGGPMLTQEGFSWKRLGPPTGPLSVVTRLPQNFP